MEVCTTLVRQKTVSTRADGGCSSASLSTWSCNYVAARAVAGHLEGFTSKEDRRKPLLQATYGLKESSEESLFLSLAGPKCDKFGHLAVPRKRCLES